MGSTSKMHLLNKCTNKGCLKIFCRRLSNKVQAGEVAQILGLYSDSLSCKNIRKILSKRKQIYRDTILDIIFYMDMCTDGSMHDSKKDTISFTSKHISLQQSSAAPEEALHLQPDHRYCVQLNKEMSAGEAYLMVGIVQLALLKMQKSKNLKHALIAVRLFNNVVQRNTSIEPEYYSLLHKAYEIIYQKAFLSSVSSSTEEHLADECQNCLFRQLFSSRDIIRAHSTIREIIENTKSLDIRENATLKTVLDIFGIIHKMNDKMQCISPEDFYLNALCSKINFKTEYKFLKSDSASILSYASFLPMHIKSELLKHSNSDTMKFYLQDSFFKSLFEGPVDPYLFVSIRREQIYGDTIALIADKKGQELKKQLKIKFVDEDGIDSGGIRKEFFQLLGLAIPNSSAFLITKNNRVWLRPGSDLQELKAVGKIVGMALYNDVVLSIPFPALIFKKMLCTPLGFEDLHDIEPEQFVSLNNFELPNEAEAEGIGMYFTADYMADGVIKTAELVPGGREIKVTGSNLLAFKASYANFFTSIVVEKEFDAFLSGFNEIIHKDALKSFRPCELEKILMGIDELNISAIIKSTVYVGYTRNDAIIKAFWELVKSFSEEDKRKLLQFITGNDRMPISGPCSLKLTIIKNGCDTERLPSSQTCFNTLLLPEYSDSSKLASKLTTAIKLTAGFYLL
ncbi:ubiquitin-protein ligase E3 A [Enteropsectra breve]|nr:ubiquitin-protein ligase E3 A [Enteropsectra breve]